MDRILQAKKKKKVKTELVKLRRVGFSNGGLLELIFSVKPSKEGVRRRKPTSTVDRTPRMSLCVCTDCPTATQFCRFIVSGPEGTSGRWFRSRRQQGGSEL